MARNVRKWLWFIGLWFASVAMLAIVASVIRAMVL
ncbi:DUF2474 family protein [Yoonia sediminilitoris]|nr:DUF2474 family protein [Yoonia sediminilitoris]